MTQQPEQPNSRLANQPAPRPVNPPQKSERPTFEELTAQAATADYSPVAAHLDDEVRAELGLPPAPAPVTVDHALAQRIRDYFFTRPEKTATLPDSVRDLLHV